MWQVAVAAAVAGSSLLAKHLFAPSHPDPNHSSLIPESFSKIEEISHAHCFATEETLTPSPPSPVTPLPSADRTGSTSQNAAPGEGDRSIFRFSSSDSGCFRAPFRFGSKKPMFSAKVSSRARTGGGIIKENAEQGKRGGERKRAPTARRVSLFFKKRKLGKNCPGKRDFSWSTDSPSFGWGLGIGIMYMMSAGKEEIGKLSCAVDETAKVVHELHAELNRRRSHETQSSRSPNGCMQVMMDENNVVGPTDTKTCSSPGADNYEGASRILTEELLPKDTEMDRLEAEFESELQKLPSFVDQASDEQRITRDCNQNRGVHDTESQSSTIFQSHGVSPVVLSEKLSEVLIKQQEDHIIELASELKLAYSKLQQREAELDALKDCLKRLTEFSLTTASDEETEACQERTSIIK